MLLNRTGNGARGLGCMPTGGTMTENGLRKVAFLLLVGLIFYVAAWGGS